MGFPPPGPVPAPGATCSTLPCRRGWQRGRPSDPLLACVPSDRRRCGARAMMPPGFACGSGTSPRPGGNRSVRRGSRPGRRPLVESRDCLPPRRSPPTAPLSGRLVADGPDACHRGTPRPGAGANMGQACSGEARPGDRTSRPAPTGDASTLSTRLPSMSATSTSWSVTNPAVPPYSSTTSARCSPDRRKASRTRSAGASSGT